MVSGETDTARGAAGTAGSVTAGAHRSVPVGPFHVADLTRAGLGEAVGELAGATAGRRPSVVFALHVGGLNSRRDRSFVAAMAQADLVYADGGSTVLVAKLAGAREIERAVTTDVGWDFLAALGRQLGRPPRIALVGGADGLAAGAGEALAAGGAGEVVAAEHGYRSDWTDVLVRLRDARPDALIVGLGAPREMTWIVEHRDELPPCLVFTCGGWFGYLVGDEARAPAILLHPGLEWIARFAQAPRRLGPRYARGVASTAALAALAVLRRPRRMPAAQRPGQRS